jgi:hypothetical protein
MQVGEVAATAARHEYFLANFVRAFEYDNTTAALPCCNSAHKSGGPTTKDDDIVFFHCGNIAGAIVQ